MKYSPATLFKLALRGQHKGHPNVADPPLRKNHDVVIIGAGGHGPAIAHNLIGQLMCRWSATTA